MRRVEIAALRTVAAPALPRRSALIGVERLLLAIGIVLSGWYALAQLQIAYDQAMASRELEAITIPVPAARVPVPLATGAIVGRVEIPRIGVSAVVREGDDTGTLRRAVGHIPGTALPGDSGNAALAGHRDTFFRGLRNIRNGDEIVVTVPAGGAHYVVRTTRIVDPSDVSVLAPTSGSTLTLVTCYPFNYLGAAPRRFIVHAERTEQSGGYGEKR